MRKLSESGSAVDAIAALTIAVQQLQAAMSVFAQSLQQSVPRSAAAEDELAGARPENRAYMADKAYLAASGSDSEPNRPPFDDRTIREFDIPGESKPSLPNSHEAQNEDLLFPSLSVNRPAASLRPLPPPSANVPDSSSAERLAEAIGRLADSILLGGGRSGSALHPGEAQGGLNGLLQSARVGARPDGYN